MFYFLFLFFIFFNPLYGMEDKKSEAFRKVWNGTYRDQFGVGFHKDYIIDRMERSCVILKYLLVGSVAGVAGSSIFALFKGWQWHQDKLPNSDWALFGIPLIPLVFGYCAYKCQKAYRCVNNKKSKFENYLEERNKIIKEKDDSNKKI